MEMTTPDQVLALTGSAATRKSALKLAQVGWWLTLSASERAAWGEIRGSGAVPYQVRIDRHNAAAYKCSCPSRQQPCKHSLALMLLHLSQPDAFAPAAPPPWVTAWLAARDAKATRKTTAEVADTEAQARRVSEREAKVMAGIEALDLWLRDLVRGGFDGLPARGGAFWEAPAARMVDAQARGLATALQELAKIPGSGAGWAERLLERAGRLYLLLDGYRHADALPPEVRADVRSSVGWNQKQEDVLALPAVRDNWIVLSQRVHEEDRAEIQRTWLRSLTTGQDALLLEFSFNGQPFTLRLPAGLRFEADLVFYPSGFPQRALIKERRRTLPPPPLIAGQTVAEALAAYGAALSRQPWLSLFPLLLRDVYPLRSGDSWILRDGSGHFLPLGAYVESGWKLLAISGGQPLTVFGEWDGERLLPLSTWAGERLILL